METAFKLNGLENKIFDWISEQIEEEKDPQKVPIVYLEGGHHDPRYPVNDFAKASLTHVLRIAAKLMQSYQRQQIKIALGILSDNLGLSCSDTHCEISVDQALEKASFNIPLALQSILKNYPFVRMDRLILSHERTCKNRGLAFLRNHLKKTEHPGLFFLEQAESTLVCFETADAEEVPIAEIKKQGAWVAKCPTIMAQHYADIVQTLHKRYDAAGLMLYIGFYPIEDINKAKQGTELALDVFLPCMFPQKRIKIHNLFMSHFDLEKHLIAKASNVIEH